MAVRTSRIWSLSAHVDEREYTPLACQFVSSARGERWILTIRDEEGGIHGRASGASNRFSSTMKNRDSHSVDPSSAYREMGKESTNVNVSCECDVNDNMHLISGRCNDRFLSISTNVD